MPAATATNEPPHEAYRERLPPDCPPADAVALSRQTVLRLVPNEAVCLDDFKSQAALGRICPRNCDPCRWAGCSVYTENARPEKLAYLAKLPTLSNMRFVAHVQVNEVSGKARPGPGPEHISVWLYASFDPCGAILRLEPLP